jgi:hypothetical protein
MTVKDDKELRSLLDDYGLAMFCENPHWPETSRDALAAVLTYLDQHYIPKPDIGTMTCDSVLRDAYKALWHYEDWHAKGQPCFHDVIERLDDALPEEGTN